MAEVLEDKCNDIRIHERITQPLSENLIYLLPDILDYDKYMKMIDTLSSIHTKIAPLFYETKSIKEVISHINKICSKKKESLKQNYTDLTLEYKIIDNIKYHEYIPRIEKDKGTYLLIKLKATEISNIGKAESYYRLFPKKKKILHKSKIKFRSEPKGPMNARGRITSEDRAIKFRNDLFDNLQTINSNEELKWRNNEYGLSFFDRQKYRVKNLVHNTKKIHNELIETGTEIEKSIKDYIKYMVEGNLDDPADLLLIPATAIGLVGGIGAIGTIAYLAYNLCK